METTHDPLHLGRWSLVEEESKGRATSCTWVVILYHKAFEYGDGMFRLGWTKHRTTLRRIM
jgi:hypothetical protein